MPETLCSLFPSRAVAEAAAADLVRHGYNDVHVFGARPGETPTRDAQMEALCRAYVLKAHARLLAARLVEGAGLVVVHAPFGRAAFAERLLRRRGSLGSGLPREAPPAPRYEEATPLSSSLQLPVLTRMKHPFEAFSGLPSLTAPGWMFSKVMAFDLTTRTATPLSSALGLPVLCERGTHVSSALGLPLLVQRG
ncbi:MAG: hypothetical protein NZM27_00830 [Acetobacteraceae bacterium]|nr:hypothetical protein [Acetobacteraceae bacterium]MCX7684462.1 hypothetical protein [Acetobacteraceae bacterium]